MKMRKYISFLLLSIYSVVLLHDIVPHHHHENVAVFSFDHSCADHEHSEEVVGEHHHTNTCSEVVHESCSCNYTHEHSRNESENHANCEAFKVQLSKLFAFSFYFNYSFEQTTEKYKVIVPDQVDPELIKKLPIRRRGPPMHV